MDIGRLGGIERITIAKANWMAAHGHDVFILNTLPTYPTRQSLKTGCTLDPSIKLISFSADYNQCGKPLSWSWLKTKRVHLRKLQEFIDKEGPDIIVSASRIDGIPIQLVKRRSTKIVYESHTQLRAIKGIDYSSALGWLAIKLKRLYIDILLGIKISRYIVLTKEDLNHFVGNHKKISAIANPVCIDPIVSKEKNKIIISHGRLDSVKNYSELIDAMSVITTRHPDWQLHIYGDGVLRDSLLQQIEKKHLQSLVKLMGITHNVPQVLSQAGIFASTSTIEGFPLSTLEAMACGLPIVSYRNAACDEMIKQSRFGILCEINDIQGLTSAILQLIEDAELRKELASNALRMSQNYSRDTIFSMHETIYRSITKQETPRS